jgi:hypothetical protein
MIRCMLRRIFDAGIFYCSENSLQCYNESAEPTAELIIRIRSMQPGARDRLTRATATEPNTPCSVLVLAFRHPRLYF